MVIGTHQPFRIATYTDGQRDLPAGVTEWDLRSKRYRRLFQGVYVSAKATITPALMAQGALLLFDGDAVASHQSAARIWGGIVPDGGPVHVTCLGKRVQIKGIRCHRVKVGQLGTRIKGVRVTTPAQTFVDLSDELDLVDLVVFGDSLVKAGHATPELLVQAAMVYRGRRRSLARRAAGLVRSEVDSPMETRLRMLMVLAGLPEPVINHKIWWEDGRLRWRFDLSFPEFCLIIEYDGRQHAESDLQWGIDVDRREWLDANGWRLVVVRAKDIYKTPAQTLRRIIEAMRDKGMPVPKLSEEWRLHFPSLPEDIATPA